MKFVISSSQLNGRLANLGRVIVQKNSIAILECFLFELKNGVLHITASDSENTLSTEISTNECDCDIAFAINARNIQEALKEIPEQPVEFYINEGNLDLTIQYQGGEFRFKAQSADAYPRPVVSDNDMETVNVHADVLLSGLQRAIMAAATDTARPVMSGCFFDRRGKELAIVASDGNILALTRTRVETSREDENNFNLPPKPAQLLRAVLAKEAGQVGITFGGQKAIIATECYTLYCRLIEGRYPNYRSVIPAHNDNQMTISRTAFISTLRRVSVCSSSAAPLAKMRIEDGRLIISTQNLELSQSAEETILCEYNGMPLTIGFKAPFLLNLLNNLESENVVVKLADATRAGIFVPEEQNEREEVLMMLMPMLVD